ncbi:aspartate/glutamate racemase family protein [Streptomyces sp. NPDC059070]|uniref:aspartate/glutamate racemase family protein n=1 Tax=Streptomyces sp. NPDC059070 TaxID=3346713 RepID=UPI0036BDA58C
MSTLALLHTSAVHVPVFDALRDEDHPGLELRHLVYEELLGRARESGPAAVAAATRDVIARAREEGVTAVLCTCSSIGAVAEAAGAELGVPVLRSDRPMAAAAVAHGPDIVVLATVESTVGPTTELIREEAAAAGREISVRTVVADRAWPHFEKGDLEGYYRVVAEELEAIVEGDVIVLAQGSMAPAAQYVASSVPVLSSPRLGLAAAASLV